MKKPSLQTLPVMTLMELPNSDSGGQEFCSNLEAPKECENQSKNRVSAGSVLTEGYGSASTTRALSEEE